MVCLCRHRFYRISPWQNHGRIWLECVFYCDGDMRNMHACPAHPLVDGGSLSQSRGIFLVHDIKWPNSKKRSYMIAPIRTMFPKVAGSAGMLQLTAIQANLPNQRFSLLCGQNKQFQRTTKAITTTGITTFKRNSMELAGQLMIPTGLSYLNYEVSETDGEKLFFLGLTGLTALAAIYQVFKRDDPPAAAESKSSVKSVKW